MRYTLVRWASDLESDGRRFDSRLPKSRFRITFSSILGCLGMCLGVVWNVSDGFGPFLDGFGMVLEKMDGPNNI